MDTSLHFHVCAAAPWAVTRCVDHHGSSWHQTSMTTLIYIDCSNFAESTACNRPGSSRHHKSPSPNHCAGVNHMQLSYASRSPNRTCVYSPLVPMDISKTSLDFKNPFISDIHSCVPEYFRICRHLLDIQLRAQVSKSFSIFTG